MALTVLQIIQAACKRIGILSPMSAVSAVDQQIIQIVALSEEEGQEQARYQWETLVQQASFTTVASQIQGSVQTFAPGWEYVINDTIWNRTLRRPVYGPRSPQEWQQSQAMQINGPFNTFRIMQDQINFYPIPVAGQSCFFEFKSSNWISTSVGGTSSFWTNDADTPLLDSQIIIMGAIWRFKQAKGLSYAEDFAKYEALLEDKKARDGTKPTLNLNGGCQYEIQPVVAVPRGSFTK